MTYDLRTLADGAASAWDDAPEVLKPILRDCADALIEAAGRIALLEQRVDIPQPSTMSGWAEPDCPDDAAALIRLACEYHGVEVPVKAEHAQFFEVEDLLDLVQADGSIHDLDQYDENNMQTTLGAVLCGLMKRLEKAEAEVNRLRVYASYANFD